MVKPSVQRTIADLHAEILSCAGVSDAAFKRLRYEGAASFRANLKAVLCALQALAESLMAYILLEEEAIFPYILRHIPRHEAAVYRFKSEHREFKEKLCLLKGRVDALAADPEDPTKGRAALGDIYFESLYLASYLKVHIQNEENRLYFMMDGELHESEKNDLLERMNKTLRQA